MSETTEGEWVLDRGLGGTPGVWIKSDQDLNPHIDICLARAMGSNVPNEEAIANIRVMAASKKLLAACKCDDARSKLEACEIDRVDFKEVCLSLGWDGNGHPFNFSDRLRREAIAAATGTS